MATRPQNMLAATSQASGAWLHMAIEHGIENRWNIAWETAVGSTEALAADLTTAAEGRVSGRGDGIGGAARGVVAANG